jgi:hypothetical protein
VDANSVGEGSRSLLGFEGRPIVLARVNTLTNRNEPRLGTAAETEGDTIPGLPYSGTSTLSNRSSGSVTRRRGMQPSINAVLGVAPTRSYLGVDTSGSGSGSRVIAQSGDAARSDGERESLMGDNEADGEIVTAADTISSILALSYLDVNLSVEIEREYA